MIELFVGLVIFLLSIGGDNPKVKSVPDYNKVNSIIVITQTPSSTTIINSNSSLNIKQGYAEISVNIGKPVPEKVSAYNSESIKFVGELPLNAVDNSPSLIPCSENQDFCENSANHKQNPSPTLNLTPTPTAIPSPTIAITPQPTIKPIPTICPEKPYECPLIMCIEVREGLRYPEYDTCDCRCNPIIL